MGKAKSAAKEFKRAKAKDAKRVERGKAAISSELSKLKETQARQKAAVKSSSTLASQLNKAAAVATKEASSKAGGDPSTAKRAANDADRAMKEAENAAKAQEELKGILKATEQRIKG